MSYPTDPLSVQVRDRFVAALQDIVAGDDYFFTADVVYDNYKNWKERQGDRAYEVWFGSGGTWEEFIGDQAAETFTVIVHGSTQNDENAPRTVRCLIRDVRKAILDDAELSELCSRVTLGETRTDNGAGAMVGSGWFDQEFFCTISGAIDEL